MQTGEEADLGAQVPRVGSDDSQRVRGGAKQDAVHHELVLQGNGGNFVGHREDDVEVLGGEQRRPARVDPGGSCQGLAAWAMSVSARVVPDARMPAAVALLDVTTERGRPTLFDGRHDPPVGRRQRRACVNTIGIPCWRNTSATVSRVRSTGGTLSAWRRQRQMRLDGEGGRAGWLPSKPWSWRGADNARSSRGGGARAEVGSCGDQSPPQGGVPRMRRAGDAV